MTGVFGAVMSVVVGVFVDAEALAVVCVLNDVATGLVVVARSATVVELTS